MREAAEKILTSVDDDGLKLRVPSRRGYRSGGQAWKIAFGSPKVTRLPEFSSPASEETSVAALAIFGIVGM